MHSDNNSDTFVFKLFTELCHILLQLLLRIYDKLYLSRLSYSGIYATFHSAIIQPPKQLTFQLYIKNTRLCHICIINRTHMLHLNSRYPTSG